MTLLFNRLADKEKRRSLRHVPPKPETLLWAKLRSRQLHNLKFRRQYSIGKYVADFYCPELHLVVELDGNSHFNNEAQLYDKQRNDFMETLGLTVLRFTNRDVTENMEGVLERISDFKKTSHQ